MKRILVCTDFSETSDLVLKSADELARRHHGKVDLLYVSELGLHLDLVLNESLVKSYRDAFLGDLRETMVKRMSEQIQRCGSSASPVFKEGAVAESILNLADEGNYDLIVMGHGQRPGLKQYLGSNAYKVISSSPLPVLIVKKSLSFARVAGLVDESRPRDRLIIGTYDFLRNFKYQEALFISLWMDFPSPFGNSEEGAEVRDRLSEEITHFKRQGEKVDMVIEPTRELKLAYPLEKILKERNVDVVVLKRFSDRNLKRVYIGSTTKRLLEIFEGNLLVLPAE